MNQLDSLRRLELNDCSFLETFPTLPWNIEVLEIRRTAIKEVASSSIERRHVLKIIDMLDNQSLVSLPSSIFELRSLHTLHLSCCSNLKNLPEIPGPIKSLKCLNLERSGIRELSSSIEHLISIESLDMDKCKSLESVPSSICNMASLSDLKLSNCPKLEYFPASAGFLHWDLERLVLINSNVIEIPESIKRLPKLRELRVNSCTRLRSLPELPPSLQFLDASGCESLEVVSNSKRALAQEFWDYTHVAEKMLEYSIFCDCSKLNHDGLHNIIIDFQLRVFRNIAMRPLSMEYQSWNGPEVHACCPGNEIPKWFEYQTEGCCINMKLPPQWHNSNFLGFVVCAKGDSYSFAPQLGLYCRLNLIPAYGENHIFTWAFTKWDCGYEELPTTSYSSHLYMWYEHEDYHDCLDAVEASFDFSFEEFVTSEDHWNNSSKIEVKKCGVHMLYGKDLQEFGLNLGAFSDQLAHIGTVNSDTDEPRLKKIKFTNPSNC